MNTVRRDTSCDPTTHAPSLGLTQPRGMVLLNWATRSACAWVSGGHIPSSGSVLMPGPVMVVKVTRLAKHKHIKPKTLKAPNNVRWIQSENGRTHGPPSDSRVLVSQVHVHLPGSRQESLFSILSHQLGHARGNLILEHAKHVTFSSYGFEREAHARSHTGEPTARREVSHGWLQLTSSPPELYP